jgi:hypothetical protein
LQEVLQQVQLAIQPAQAQTCAPQASSSNSTAGNLALDLMC